MKRWVISWELCSFAATPEESAVQGLHLAGARSSGSSPEMQEQPTAPAQDAKSRWNGTRAAVLSSREWPGEWGQQQSWHAGPWAQHTLCCGGWLSSYRNWILWAWLPEGDWERCKTHHPLASPPV